MKQILMVLFLGFGLSTFVFADEPKVDITSYRLAGTNTSSAELCGKVTGATSVPTYVRVMVDEKSNSPGIYNVIVGPEGKFCVSVVTYRGTAVATLWGQTESSSLSIK